MNKPNTITSFRELPKLVPARVQMTKAGGFVRARYAGKRNFVFGATEEQALQRLQRAIECPR